LTAALYRSTESFDIDDPYDDDFDGFYAAYHNLLREDVHEEYYSPSLLAHPSTARFWRLPDLRDLTDTSDQLRGVRREGIGHFTRIPRWAYLVTLTQWRQPTLSTEMLTQLAISSLQKAISRQQRECPDVRPYSETQARFWLKRMGINSRSANLRKDTWAIVYTFSTLIGRGDYDVRQGELLYSTERWESTGPEALEPDLDGSKKSVIQACGWPDGGVSGEIAEMGWEEELGSEEEVLFLATVAAKEIEVLGVDADGHSDDVNYAIRSHMLLGVLRAAFETDRTQHVDGLKRQFVSAGRLDDDGVGPWIERVLEVMEPYVAVDGGVAAHKRPADASGWSELLRLILEENGQVFGRWKMCGMDRNPPFLLKARMDLVTDHHPGMSG
jgi:hypothetical protein